MEPPFINQKTNRALLSNIKNATPLNPNASLKKNSVGVENISVNSSAKKANNNNVVKINNNSKNNILFTPSKGVSKARSSTANTAIVAQQEVFLDLTSIQNDLKRIGVDTTGGISPCASPLKDSVPISMIDLDTTAAITTITKESVESESSLVVPVGPSLDLVHTKTTSLENKVYDASFFMSLKSANTVRPKEIDIVENHQKEIVVSLPTTPFILNNSINSQRNSQQQQKTNIPIFSPQVSPFKIAYNLQQSSSQSPSKQIVTPKKNNGALSTTTTPASYYRDNNYSATKSNNYSATKKQNPIPFALNTTPVKANKIVTYTPQSNKKSATEESTIAVVDTEDTEESSVPSVETPKKLREIDPKRLAARQRQIDIGKMTAGYKNYIATVPKSKRKPTDPKTPNKNQVCSKRSWDGQVKKWRRLLHQYDPTPIPFNEEEIEKEMKLMELEQEQKDKETTDTSAINDDDQVVPAIEN
ncbi:hypothetical protein DICPUDRAFT_94190 [Dictyostelium purpureum]|uniref:Histone RNA hairpin-binding protein RNA-binding domain-containing protein n=1 Tax=Dictyostelium purpureum TaxID=5786 RepID=F0ZGI2_DICPU|nr:uncharacterized protein DICPUDRAFT_94190 [Dictyostelium purpureum]EGC36948.1 hypothetical protein DICPUDRAFT_94190 [Dictyostelium purpureum]|eukprot:XP_003286516.1 hypothetical protein DICPUDRAFT_94190 [Dictyostelium purpureum]